MADLLSILSFLLKTQALLVLGIHSINRTVEEERERVQTESRQLLKQTADVLEEQLRRILGQKNITYTVIIVSTLASVAWGVHHVVYGDLFIPVWPFSLALVETLVVFFSIETIYYLTSRWVVPSLRNNVQFERVVTWTTFSGALLLSLTSTVGCMYALDVPCSVGDYLNYFADYLFFIILFVSGLGGIGIVDTISNSVSSHLPIKKPSQVAYLSLFFASLVGLYVILREQTPILGEEAVLGAAGLEVALAIGLGYLIYWLTRRKGIQHSSSLVYIVLMFALSGLFIGYNLRDLGPPDFNSPSLSLTDSAILLATPLTLFAVGYTNILFQMPRKLEQKLKVPGGKLAPSFTFLLLFAALANFQIATFSFGPNIFLYQKEIPLALGLLVGGVLFTVKKVRKVARRRALKTSAIVPFCNHCGLRLESTSRFCWNCGNPISTEPEHVFFVGDGEIIRIGKARHSTKRKLAIVLAAGPVGFLAFGRDVVRKREAEGQLVVTGRAVYLAGEFFPLSRMAGTKRGHYSNSIILTMGANPQRPVSERARIHGPQDFKVEVEIKANDPETFSSSIERAKTENLQKLDLGGGTAS